ncbi:hypothetical protein PAA26_01120 [Methanomassiliicoccaceae archaeon COG_1]|nr:hypothetical protein [Methanomassiliicoccaceae archaeon COG_1]
MTPTLPAAMMMNTLWNMLVNPVARASAVRGPPMPNTSFIAERSGRNPLNETRTRILPARYQYNPNEVETTVPIAVAHPAPATPISTS